ncbi:sacsin N-terminal ATP-binding-like domain-containing protein [Kitasatospora sp. NPDC051853]|uniref:sacsin N-terminal ATP-binding-like domain-containing protein n=1 Tax=Kitasatospora sp. NPDC051853 TaxID=3364058 RepID=UPI00378EE0C7
MQGRDGAGAAERYARELRGYSEQILREWQGTSTWKPGEQLRAVSLMSSRDYAGRFLLELLQNGHDAHPADRTDGQVHVLLDETEGPHGTLYVANGGRPFGWQQVERICKLAQSDKRVGDGIGNKGLGFRSVLEIAESPEVYSDGPDGPGSRSGGGLDGYRFRFATPEDLRVLLGDDALAERAAKEFPPLQLPFPVDELPPTCAELSALGHVTVVRLGLRSDVAHQAAVRRLEELAGARTPVMLFLRRLGGLVLEHRTADGSTDRVDLVREERPVARDRPEVPGTGERPSAPAVSVVRVDLGAAGEFLVARGTLPGLRLRATLDEAVAEGSLDESWLDWREVAEVEAALPTGAEASQRGQLYTFLPLGGDVAAPLRGHVNAPFFTKMDRTDLDREHPLNAMLFDALAETCLLAAERWRSLPGAGHRAAAVDVVAWETGARAGGLLAAAAERVHGCAFAEVPLVPVLEEGAAAWTTPQRAVLWPTGEFAALSAEAAGAAGIPVADPSRRRSAAAAGTGVHLAEVLPGADVDGAGRVRREDRRAAAPARPRRAGRDLGRRLRRPRGALRG